MMIFSSVISPKPLTLEDFEIIDFLGQGTFGKVYLTKLKSTGQLYAIKSISKEILIEYDQEENTKLEEQILLT
jgi:serine/threonine protein kinase